MALGGGNSGGSASGIKAGSAYVTLGLKNFLPRDLLNAQQSFGKFGDAIGKMGRAMALGGAAALTPLIGAMSTLNDVAKQGSIASALGLTSEQFTGIAGVAKSVGNDTKEFIESLVTLGKLGTDAAAGTEQASAAFASMGLNANEFIKLRADEQFFTLFDALNKMQDPLQRTRALMMAFGEDGGKILLPLLGKSGDELKKMAYGFAITTDDMKAATAASASYAAATSALGKAWRSVSIAAAPIVKAIADGFAQAAAPLSGFINANREIVVGLGLAAGGVTAVGVGLMILGPAIKALTASWGLFTGAVVAGKAVIAGTFAVLASPILVLPAALAGAGAAWLAFTTQGNATVKRFADGVKEAFGPTFENLKSGWVEVVEAFQDGDFESAIAIGTATIEVEWVRFTGTLTKQWRSAVQEMREELDDFGKEGVGKFMANLGRGAEAWWEDIGDLLAPPQVLQDINNGKLKGAGLLQLGGGGAAGLLQPAAAGLIMQGETPEQRQLREANEKKAAAIEAKNLRQLDKLAGNWDFGGGADFGWRDGPLGAQIPDIASRSMGGFGGNVNVGMFGSGGVGEKIADNTKRTAVAVEKLMSVGRYKEAMGITVEGGV